MGKVWTTISFPKVLMLTMSISRVDENHHLTQGNSDVIVVKVNKNEDSTLTTHDVLIRNPDNQIT